MKIAGFDIGGANTDLALVHFKENEISIVKTDFKYFPMWLKKDELGDALLDLLKGELDDVDAVGICMTAELVDAYKTKEEGVIDIVNKSKEVFNAPVGFISLQGVLEYSDAIQNPEQLAAANWIATSKLTAKVSPDCIMIDTGSTTTDIIPIKEGYERSKGRSDLSRLKTGELVYSGTLRTNVATIVDKVPLGEDYVRLASELFAITADVHMILGNINEEDYTCDTPDGAGKSRLDCMRRVSRVICADMNMLSELEIEIISAYIYKKQVEKVAAALLEVSRRESLDTVVTTGLGMDIIGTKAAKYAGFTSKSMEEILRKEECVVAPAIGTALMMGEFISANPRSE